MVSFIYNADTTPSFGAVSLVFDAATVGLDFPNCGFYSSFKGTGNASRRRVQITELQSSDKSHNFGIYGDSDD